MNNRFDRAHIAFKLLTATIAVTSILLSTTVSADSSKVIVLTSEPIGYSHSDSEGWIITFKNGLIKRGDSAPVHFSDKIQIDRTAPIYEDPFDGSEFYVYLPYSAMSSKQFMSVFAQGAQKKLALRITGTPEKTNITFLSELSSGNSSRARMRVSDQYHIPFYRLSSAQVDVVRINDGVDPLTMPAISPDQIPQPSAIVSKTTKANEKSDILTLFTPAFILRSVDEKGIHLEVEHGELQIANFFPRGFRPTKTFQFVEGESGPASRFKSMQVTIPANAENFAAVAKVFLQKQHDLLSRKLAVVFRGKTVVRNISASGELEDGWGQMLTAFQMSDHLQPTLEFDSKTEVSVVRYVHRDSVANDDGPQVTPRDEPSEEDLCEAHLTLIRAGVMGRPKLIIDNDR